MNGRVYFWLGMLEWMKVQLDSEAWEWFGDMQMDGWGWGMRVMGYLRQKEMKMYGSSVKCCAVYVKINMQFNQAPYYALQACITVEK